MHESKIEMKLEEEMKPLKKICETLEEAVKHEFEKGIEGVNVEEMGEVIDMIKDIYEAKEKLVKGCYYKQIMTAMENSEEEEKRQDKYFIDMLKEKYSDEYKEMKERYGEDEGERRFYDNYRYANGRFAPKGSGSYRPRSSGRRGRRGYDEMMPIDYRMDIEDYKMYPAEYWRDVDRSSGRMYFSGGGSSGGSGGQSGMSGGSSSGSSGDSSSRGYEEYQRGYSEGQSDGNRRGYEEGYERGRNEGRNSQIRDRREGRSGQMRRGYMETKETHSDNTPESKQAKMKSLEAYMKELSEDITEMIEGASNEEKTMLRSKVQTLAQKIQ